MKPKVLKHSYQERMKNKINKVFSKAFNSSSKNYHCFKVMMSTICFPRVDANPEHPAAAAAK